MQAVVTVLADQFGVKARYRAVDNLDRIEWEASNGQSGAGQGDYCGFILFRKRKT
jgi:hypothetical protein